jgi:hypothetical protein
VHVDAPSCERKCDTPCADPEFEGSALPGQPGEAIDHGGDDAVIVHARRCGVVAGGYLLTEVPVVGHV